MGATLYRGARASHYRGLSCCGAQAPDAQAQHLWLTGLVALRHVGSSQTRARTRVPCFGRQILNHCATREARVALILSSGLILVFVLDSFLHHLGLRPRGFQCILAPDTLRTACLNGAQSFLPSVLVCPLTSREQSLICLLHHSPLHHWGKLLCLPESSLFFSPESVSFSSEAASSPLPCLSNVIFSMEGSCGRRDLS